MSNPGSPHESYRPPESTGRSSDRAFGLVFAVFFGVVGAVAWWRAAGATNLVATALALSALFLLLAWMKPAVLAPLNRAWTSFGLLLHRIVSPLTLGGVFFLVVTPLGLLARLAGKDFLRLRRDSRARSYWIARSAARSTPESLLRQF